MPAPKKQTPPRQQAAAPRRRVAPPRRRVAEFLIGYRSRNAVLTPAQILAWYNIVDPEQYLGQFGHANVLEKKWHSRLTLKMEADSAEELMDAFDFIADPDSDGNYPIEINGIDALIVGDLLEEIE